MKSYVMGLKAPCLKMVSHLWKELLKPLWLKVWSLHPSFCALDSLRNPWLPLKYLKQPSRDLKSIFDVLHKFKKIRVKDFVNATKSFIEGKFSSSPFHWYMEHLLTPHGWRDLYFWSLTNPHYSLKSAPNEDSKQIKIKIDFITSQLLKNSWENVYKYPINVLIYLEKSSDLL